MTSRLRPGYVPPAARRAAAWGRTAAAAALVTWWFPHFANGFFTVASWSAIAVPSVTVVMCVDRFVLPGSGCAGRWTGCRRGGSPASRALAAVRSALSAHDPLDAAREYARLLQSYKLMLWNTLAADIS